MSSNFSNGNYGNVLLKTCQVVIQVPNGSNAQARALLDSGSETCFITERLAQQLHLSHCRGPLISCIGETSPVVRPEGLVDIRIKDIHQTGEVNSVQALVLPRITTATPARPISRQRNWMHLTDLSLADPDYGIPRSVDLLLGADMFSRVFLHGMWFGPLGSPSAFKTQFGWVLTGSIQGHNNSRKSCYFAVREEGPFDSDELLKRFWEIENPYMQEPMLSINEKRVMEHFKENHLRDTKGRFVVPLPLNPDATPLGESRSRAVR